jgi:ATP phosphoribosyltransferase
MGKELTIAMPKGRIFEEAADMLRKAGYQLPEEFDDSRKLIIQVPEENLRFILAKPMDVTHMSSSGWPMSESPAKMCCWKKNAMSTRFLI